MNSILYAKIKNATRFCRDLDVRRKVSLFLKALELGSVKDACEFFGVSRDFYYRWHRRFVNANYNVESLFEKSKKPENSPQKIPVKIVRQIKYYRKNYRYGPNRIGYYLKSNHDIEVSSSTIFRTILRNKWFVKKYRTKKINPHKKRYNLEWPGQMMQMDIKYVPEKIRGEQYYSFNAIDDCTRWRFARIYKDKSLESCLEFTKDLIRFAPFKIQGIQTDNDVVFTNRFNPYAQDPERHLFPETLKEHGVRHKLLPPAAKELNGKVERSHRTDDEEFFWKGPLSDFYSLKKAYAQWIWEYNHDRPHMSLNGLTPIQKLLERQYVMIFTIALHLGMAPLKLIKEEKPFVKPTMVVTYLKYLNYLDSSYECVSDVMEFYRLQLASVEKRLIIFSNL